MDSTEIRTPRKSKEYNLLKEQRKSQIIVPPIKKWMSKQLHNILRTCILHSGRFHLSQKILKINAVPKKLIFFSIVSPWEPWWHNQAVAQETTMARYLDTLMGSWSQYDGADDFDADTWNFSYLRKILTETFDTILLTK